MSDAPRILIWDIENSPAEGEFWGPPYNTNIIRITKPSSVISFAAKWHGDKRTIFKSDFHDSHEEMVTAARDLLDEADAVVSFNGVKHDSPHMRTEIELLGITPPSPWIEIDLYRVVKRVFKFQTNRLAFVAQQLLADTKLQHDGHDLWVRCAEGDPRAWSLMRRYNIKDVALTEQLYDELKGWLPSSMRVLRFDDSCDKCGSHDLQRRGYVRTGLSKFQQYQCQSCGGWSRGKKAIETAEIRGI